MIFWTGINSFSRVRLSKDGKPFLRAMKKKLFPLQMFRIHVILVVTCNEDVLGNHDFNPDKLAPCSHEEARQRLFYCANHFSKSCNSLLVETVDTDVVVIAGDAF